MPLHPKELYNFIATSLAEDIQNGDHSSLCCLDSKVIGEAHLLVKDNGILAGVEVANAIFQTVDPYLVVENKLFDGDKIKKGDIVLIVRGSASSILSAERLVLNTMQRMSGIAAKTRQYVEAINGTNCKVIDTRKTTPGIRFLEKYAVTVGGGANHRMGLYDMIMLKDNHIDFSGGITNAVAKAKKYLLDKKLDLKIEVETRNIEEVKEAVATNAVDRIMLDNYTPEKIIEALKYIPSNIETEASGGIVLENIKNYAETGVNFISVGALTHSATALDLSLKAKIFK